MTIHDPTRRALIRTLLLGTGCVGLRALATGLPTPFLRTGSVARAQQADKPTALILAHSGQGDPLNANCPGSYVAGVEHSPDPAMAETDVQLGSMTSRAAAPWATLSEPLRDRMSFFHHRTHTNAHPEMGKVLTSHGSVKEADSNSTTMLASMLSSQLAGPLGSTQLEPITMGRDRITFQGRPLDLVRPTDLQGLFQAPSELADQLRALRDAELDALYADLKQSGTRAQRVFLDRYAQGRTQARDIGEQLAALIDRVPLEADAPNGARDELLCAVALIRLNVAPVVTVRIPFGGDNHGDSDLAAEVEQTVSGVSAMQFLHDELVAAGLDDSVTFASLNVFGRTLKRNSQGGRNHNANHHVMCMFGPRVRGGVVGGPVADNRDFSAQPIDSSTGAVAPDGDIDPSISLESAMATLGAAVGLSGDVLERTIRGGKVVTSSVA